ncbi:DUF4129 domain-containing protein [Actinomadura algeriensis]|uniref:Flp pilus assembly protein TadB n=1 Tax=Actinomadura algeriensis TaxID=1679523 RepID=A0ABR9JLL8_9ACTN|nr:DUF4129 domain-containing protein [Actinomadura algeriensis]MBE1531403.1 Flp pilus assembly protein TadB [Actinomadura algeriensis]
MLGSSTLDPIDREQAREMARRELEKQVYQREEPSWLERTWNDFLDWLRELLNRAPSGEPQGGSGSGLLAIVVIVLVLAAAIALVAWLMWGRGNPRSRRGALLDEERPATALDHRTAAERHAAAGQWAEAIRERLRAVARDLEERAVLGPRPGRTADELAGEAGAAVPELADALRAAVRIFDDVWYGDRPGTADGYAQVKDLDDRLRAARPAPLESDGLVPAGRAGTPGTGDEDGGPRW